MVLEHAAETELKSLFDPPSLDPVLSMLLVYATESGLKSGSGPSCLYRSKLIRMLLGPGTETDVRPGHVPKAPNPFSHPLSTS